MKLLNLKNEIKLNHEIDNIIFDNFNNYSLSSLQHILNFIVDDLYELIEKINKNNEFFNNDEKIDDEIVEIYHDEIHHNIKMNLLNRYYLYNKIPIYENDDLINLIDINKFKFDEDKYNLIQFKSIVNLLNNYHELLIEIDENNIDDYDEYYQIFYELEYIKNNEIKFKQYSYEFNEIYIIEKMINNKSLLKLFYKYIDDIVEKIVDEINEDLKNY